MRLPCCLLATLTMTGCASVPISVSENIVVERRTEPEFGELGVANIGDQVVSSSVKTMTPGIEVLNATQFGKKEGEASILTCAITVEPGKWPWHGVFQKEEVVADCYGPIDMKATLSDGSTSGWWGGCPGYSIKRDICRDKDGIFFVPTGAGRFYLEQDHANIRVASISVAPQSSFRRELIYAQRDDDLLRFTYNEFRNDSAAPISSLTIQHDLRNGRRFEVNDWIIDISNVTDLGIEYRILPKS